MPIYYPDILEEEYDPVSFSYGEKDVMLYALSIGFGADPMDEKELPFVTERDLKTTPTAATGMSTVSAEHRRLDFRPEPRHPPKRLSRPNMLMLLHGEQKIELHRPLPTQGRFNRQARIIDVWDKGPGKGAVVYVENQWIDEAGEKVVTATSGFFFRGDGGCGGSDKPAPEPHRMPDRAPDRTVELATWRGQPLLYRLNGDKNPIHAYPEVALAAGFTQPILHGLCTYGVTCRGVLQACCDYQPERIASHQVRFSSPVLAGETIALDLWEDGDVISFEARSKERGVTVVKHGKTVLRG